MEQTQHEQNTAAPKKKKNGLIIAIAIAAVIVLAVAGVLIGISVSRESRYEEAMRLLDDGDFEEAIAIHQKLGDYNNLSAKIADAADYEAKKLLKKDSYKKAAALYEDVAAYPDALEMIHERLADRMAKVFLEYDTDAVVDLLHYFDDFEAARAQLLQTMDDCAAELWDNGRYSAIEFYSDLKAQGVSVDAIAVIIAQYCCDELANNDYYDAFTYLSVISDHEEAMALFRGSLITAAEESFAQMNFWQINDLYYWIEMYEYAFDELDALVFEQGCAFMESEQYDYAKDCFNLITDYDGVAEKLEQLQIVELMQTMHYYMQNGRYSRAERLLEQYSGTIYESLFEIYISYCSDSGFLADLEAALVARAEILEGGEDYEAAVNAELSLLDKYSGAYFADSTLSGFAATYLNELYGQLNAINNYLYYGGDDYTFYIEWTQAAAGRYQVIDQLNAIYGFGNGNAHIESMLGNGESTQKWIDAWSSVHYDLSWQLWNSSADWDGYEYYMEFCNYTQYTYSVVIYIAFADSYGNYISEVTCEFADIAPGSTCRLPIEFPQTDWYYWYIDWNILTISLNGELLG